MKESPNSNYPKLIFRETFRDEASVRKNGGLPSNVTFSNGVGSFNGTSSGISYKERGESGNSKRSVRVVFKTTQTEMYSAIFSQGSASTLNLFSLDYNGYVCLIGFGNDVLSSTKLVNDGLWHESVVTYDGATVYLYVDGVLVTSRTIVLNTIPTITTIGYRLSGSIQPFKGVIDLVEIYQGTLTPSEVKNLYNNSWNKEQRGLNLLLDFDSTQGSIKNKQAGRVLSTVLDNNFNFTSWWNAAGATINNSNSFTTVTAPAGIYNTSVRVVVGKKYRVIIKGSTTCASGVKLTDTGNRVLDALALTGTFDLVYEINWIGTLTPTNFIYFINVSEGTTIIEKLIVQEIQPTPSSTDVSIKKIGQSYSANFNGTTSKIDTGTDFIGTKAVTVMGWIKPYSSGESGGRIIDNVKYILIKSSSGRFAISSNGSSLVYSANNSYYYNKLQFISVTRASDGKVNFYIGDTKTAPTISGTPDQSSGTPVAGTTNVIIGNNNDQARTFDGLISKLKVVEGILSLQEITQFWSETRKEII